MSMSSSLQDLTTVEVNRFFKSANVTDKLFKEYVRTISSYFKRITAISKIVIEFKISNVFKPFDHISQDDRVYRLYVQPLFFILALATFIIISVYIRRHKSVKSYILTVVFLLNDTIGVLLPLPFHFAFLPRNGDDINLGYSYCELYRVFVTFLPQVLFYHSQWLKFVACIFECMSIYYPSKAEWLYRKRFLTTLLVVALFVAMTISSLMQYDVEFEKLVYLDRNTKEIVESCIMVPSAIYDVNSRSYNLLRIVAPMTIGIIVPFVCMLLASITLVVEIHAQSKSQNLQNNRKMAPAQYQHVVFVAITSIIFVVILLPRLTCEILLTDEISRELYHQTWTRTSYLISKTMYHVTVPVTLLVYYAVKKTMERKITNESLGDLVDRESTNNTDMKLA